MSSIYFHLAGRLGNQLFQYAFAHQLASQFKREIRFFFDKFHHSGNYEWGVAAHMSSCQHVTGILRSNERGLLLKASDGLFSRNKSMFELLNKSARIMRTMDAFEFPEMPNKPPFLVTGFYSNSSSIEFAPVFLNELVDHLSSIGNLDRLIVEQEYEIVHIRGTDMKNSVYGTLDHNYYLSLPDSDLPRYVLTDDVRHAESVTRGLNVARFFSPEMLNPWEAIEVMRRSRKVYVSNSTLAWWGGYLCRRNGGEVILPKPFFRRNFSASASLHVEGFNYLEASFEPEING